MSAGFLQHEKGTAHLSTEGLVFVQLKYSFWDQSKYPLWLSPQHLNYGNKNNEVFAELLEKLIVQIPLAG